MISNAYDIPIFVALVNTNFNSTKLKSTSVHDAFSTKKWMSCSKKYLVSIDANNVSTICVVREVFFIMSIYAFEIFDSQKHIRSSENFVLHPFGFII